MCCSKSVAVFSSSDEEEEQTSARNQSIYRRQLRYKSNILSLPSSMNVVERRIGVLKNRFRCLLGARQLHYSPNLAAKITAVCAASHNICIHFKIDSTAFDNIVENQEVYGSTGNNAGLTATNIRVNKY
ncbi:hypothetical protein FF38_06221 [Lucilia cuprina]|uniref:DDE Tnp4 domain-containing protein n=1 Tax=Lucilia cuprina TaxID=7375 RepID=A0A0L0CCU9_LUCCU|nr:hypothetical protein FF38_06221 [Lucilia cuprina]